MSVRDVLVRLRHRSEPAPAAPSTFCVAPSTSMYLDQLGNVRACCQNSDHTLGSITESSLREIWEGARTRQLREALAERDLTLGCQFCRWQVEEGNEQLAYARTFDHLALDEEAPRWPRQLELSLSNACNLQCVMCNGEWSSAIRTHREGRPPLPQVYDDRFFDDLAPFLEHVEVVKILGGEPFLGRESLRVMEMLVDMGSRAEVHVTTNGTQWSRRVERILEALPMVVIISLDGAEREAYEAVRVGADFDAVMANVDRFRAYGRDHGRPISIAHCLMTTNADHFPDFLRWADERDLPVGVNTVTAPVELSVFHLHPDELGALVRRYEAIDADVRAGLGRNRGVWVGQLERLQHRLTAVERFEDADYYLGRTILGVPLRRRPDGRGDERREAARATAAEADDGEGPVCLLVGPDQRVLAVEPHHAHLAGIDVGALAGREAGDLLAAVAERHGPAAPVVERAEDPDQQQWRIVGDDGVELVAAMAPRRDHAGVASSVELWIGARTPTGDHDGRAPRDLRAEVGGADVLELLVDGAGALERVVDAGWAADLRLERAVGRDASELVDLLSEALGPLGDVAGPGAGGRARFEVRFEGTGSGPLLLVAAVGGRTDGPGSTVVVAAPVAAAER